MEIEASIKTQRALRIEMDPENGLPRHGTVTLGGSMEKKVGFLRRSQQPNKVLVRVNPIEGGLARLMGKIESKVHSP